MLQRENSVVFVAADKDACALWRLYFPHVSLPGSAFFYFGQRPDFEKMAGHDVVVVQRCCTLPQYELIKACKQLGMRVIYDLDDNMWQIPEKNPAYEPLKRYRDGFGTCIRMADVCTVSTPRLAKIVRKHVREMKSLTDGQEIPIVVCRNWIEERLFAPQMPVGGRVTVGWAGSSSHIEDLELISAAVLTCAKEHPEVAFEYRGCVPDERHPVRKLRNWQHRLWTPVAEYPARMPLWGWNIALAPVTDHDFNASKSAIKMIEAGYCGIPCLASWMEPYEEFCSHDRELKWLLCAGASAFTTKLRTLLHESERARELGARMHLVMERFYSYRRPHDGWAEAISLARNRVLSPV